MLTRNLRRGIALSSMLAFVVMIAMAFSGTADGSMPGLTRLLISRSATPGGTAALLIRLCTLWFGLLIGVISLFLFRSIQHIDLSTEPEIAWKKRAREEQKYSMQRTPDGLGWRQHRYTGEKAL